MRPVRRADNLTTFMCRLSSNLGASTSWNPQGLSRPVMGLLYLTCSNLLSRNCYLHLYVSSRFSNIWTTFSTSLCRRHLSFSASVFYPLSFHNLNLNHANPILSFEFHWSVCISLPHSCSCSSMTLEIYFLSFFSPLDFPLACTIITLYCSVKLNSTMLTL